MNFSYARNHAEGWTPRRLMQLRHFAAKGLTLQEIAMRVGRPAADCDLALWALLGRSLTEAAKHLEGK